MSQRNHKLDRLKTSHRSPMDQSQNCMVCSLFILLVILFNGFLGRGRRKLPPGPMGLPLLGNLLDMGRKPHESLAKLSKKHGPLMTVRLGATTTVVASSSEMAREILQKNDEAFSGRVVPHAATAMTNYDQALIWIPAGHEWRLIRRALSTHLMHPQKLEALVDHRHRAVREMVARVMEASKVGEAVGVGALAFTTALNQMSNVCFSVNVADYESQRVDGFRQVVKTVMEVDGKFNIADAFPWLKPLDPQGLRRRAKVAYDWLEAFSDGFVTRRLRERESRRPLPAQNKDLLDSLLDFGQEEPKFHTAHTKVLLVDLILGGTETSSITTEWVMAELMAHPNIMAKARQEIAEKAGAIGTIEESMILELPYLQAVVKETMRLHLAVPLLLPHKTEKKVEVNGYVIPKDTQTLVNAWAIARDPDHWENPTNFVPERFLGSELDFKGQHFDFLPFGSGRRMCPGIPLAQRMVTLMVASLVYHFDWKLPNGLAPEDLDMTDVFGLTLQKATPLLAVPTIIHPPKMKHY